MRENRTDADANKKELYVSGLHKYMKEAELRKLFSSVYLPTGHILQNGLLSDLHSLEISKGPELEPATTDYVKVLVLWISAKRYGLSLWHLRGIDFN